MNIRKWLKPLRPLTFEVVEWGKEIGEGERVTLIPGDDLAMHNPGEAGEVIVVKYDRGKVTIQLFGCVTTLNDVALKAAVKEARAKGLV